MQPTDNGAFVIYDSIGVVTNSPEYNYHLTNARNYIGMRNYAIKEPYTLKSGATLDPIEGGTSYGLLGIPETSLRRHASFVRYTILTISKNLIALKGLCNSIAPSKQ